MCQENTNVKMVCSMVWNGMVWYGITKKSCWSKFRENSAIYFFHLFHIENTPKNKHIGISHIRENSSFGATIQSQILTSKRFILQGCHVWTTPPPKLAISNTFPLGTHALYSLLKGASIQNPFFSYKTNFFIQVGIYLFSFFMCIQYA